MLAGRGNSLHSYTFREAGAEDFPAIETLFAGEGVEPGWAVWKYLQNPDGQARVFVAEGEDKVIVGTLAYVPRTFVLPDAEPLTALQVVDIYLRDDLRNQYVFLGLLGYARRHISGARIGVPNEFSEVFAAGQNWRVLGQYERRCFPAAVGELWAGKALGRIAPLLNGLAGIYRTVFLSGDHQDVAMQPVTRFQRDFVAGSGVIHGVRTANYLNWRFINNPFGRYQAFEFVRNGECLGYCVFTQLEFSGSRSLVLSDFMTASHRRGCMRLLVDYARQRSLALVVYRGMGLNLGKLGFVRRGPGHDCVASDVPDGEWIANLCDIDAEPGRTPAGAI